MKYGLTVGAIALVFASLSPRRASADLPELAPPADAPPAIASDVALANGPPSLLDRPAARVGVSAFSSLNTGAGVLGAIGGYVEVQRDAPDGFSPSMRVGFELGWGSMPYDGPQGFVNNPSATGTRLDIARSVFRLDLCPLRAIGAARWSNSTANIALCARGDVGTLTSTIAGFETPLVIERRPWIASGVTAQARWSFPHGFFGIELGIVAAMVRDRYFAEPHVRADETPAATFTFAIGGGAYVL